MLGEQFVVFRLGKEEYAVSIAQVKEIIHYQETTRLPNTPDYMEGVINLRGKVIPVLNLAVRFGIRASASCDRRAIIAETCAAQLGIVVDEVTEVLWLDKDSMESTPEAIADKHKIIRGIGKVADRLLILLDLGNLMSREEMSAIKEAV